MIYYQSCGIDKNDNVRYAYLQMSDLDIDKLIGKNLLRLINNFYDGNQSDFSSALSLNPTYINSVIKGNKGLGKTNMELICKKLNIQPYEFYIDDKTPIVKDSGEHERIRLYRIEEKLGIADQVREQEEIWIERAERQQGKPEKTLTEQVDEEIAKVAETLQRKFGNVQQKKKKSS